MKQKIWKQTTFGAVLGLAAWAGFTVLAAWLRGQWQFPAVSGHLVMVYGSELGAVTAQCIGAVLWGILWCNGILVFRETDWNLPVQTAVHALVCMVPALGIAWVMDFMPRNLDGLMQYLRLFGVLYGVNWVVQYLLLRQSVKKLNEKLNQEEIQMKKINFRWPAVLAAVLALCVCLPVAGMAMGNSGFFRDVMRGTAVVGTEYEQATAEIAVNVGFDNGELTVIANFLIPDAAPYRECEELAVGSYRIMTGDGKITAEGEKSENAAIANGQAVMRIPVEALNPGDYTVRIDAFIGSKKADQPLPLKGFWECELIVE